MQISDNTIFVGIKTTEKLNDHLDSSKTSMKPFFKENNPEFLQTIQIDGDQYIGKVVNSDISFENLGNIIVNVRTMLKMICPRFIFIDDSFRIIALSSNPIGIRF